ncbi:MAG TPA: ATP-dependent sacrificial sulfur transferase LarE [Candidatus Hydrogenedentes bacterium]|nr:ATP-dependent sacrificial sulfur transferase LarE [Candidatus Hydrogenedentota bacterium]HIJ72631.1 ATP-dependent sacrificial sulfur transferase LarE [Candidatus Hydrogenedentota bacterium]
MDVKEELLEKERRLKEILRGCGSIAVAYSGGVDSTYLADVAHEALGDNAHMILDDSPSIPRSELEEAKALAKTRGWRLALVQTDEFANEAFLKNDRQRCYVCKSVLFNEMLAYAREHGIAVLAYGENADDPQDAARVGAMAAAEKGVVAPLQQAGLTKDDIRQLSARRGLPTWDKASFACLSSRFPPGTRITLDAMQQIERAEETLKRLGFHQYRARHHGDLCRIEIEPAEFDKMLDLKTREHVVREIRAAGYRHVTLDLKGYQAPGQTGGASG